MPGSDAWPLSDLWTELRRAGMERHRALHPETTGIRLPVRPV